MRQKLLDFLQVELEMVEGFCNWALPLGRGNWPVSCPHLLVKYMYVHQPTEHSKTDKLDYLLKFHHGA